ncbi:sigma-70 family RNA polymerase sigma factor [Paracoccus sp. MBLB3053]|uniref:RNA polymerase sigma factor n=2 Tax=Paracoccus TaxID=265 RepID=A0A844HRX0_9RHOB|nr:MULTISPECIES: sigma-70 family RNA polymerase sigma factor [Paracoccus]MDS9470199.1 sigma-70 family RNA polymerase sigma factor [Paracoccus sp. MBLB3053]MTH62590.1 sigma-70 family RNA polymerase sigma factor [Paracoccus litorisediminis]
MLKDEIVDQIPALRAYSRCLCRSFSQAEDLVQETLLRAIEYADSFQPGTNLRAWLFTIMRNRFLTNCRKSARELTGGVDCVSDQPRVEAGQEWYMQAIEVRRVLRDMPAHYRDAIVLVGGFGESYIDAARILDCDIGTIKSRVNRARRILREALEPAL